MIPAVATLMLDGITLLLPCSAEDEGRFRALGVPAERLRLTGNIKLDVVIPPLGEAEAAKLRADLGIPSGLILLGSSTWPGEEEALVAALRAARSRGLRVSLLLVPRHAERREEIERFLAGTGLSCHFRSRGAATAEVDITVADTTGELRRLTQLADLVFVGKSLLPHTEGQTPVEAAALAKPILMGPGMGNFKNIAEDLVARGAALEVADAAALADEIPRLLADGERRQALAAAAAAWHRENTGAIARTLDVLRAELARRGQTPTS
jgi:3-deoxy-D-manno-octulosonic-acid transferase